MKMEDEKKLMIKFHFLNEFIFEIDNLPLWLRYIDGLEHVTMHQNIKGSCIVIKINLFKKNQVFNFRISEYEKNKKIKLKSYHPYLFEITIKTYQAVNGFSYVHLKTKCKPQGLFLFFGRKKLQNKSKLSLETLGEYLKLQ
ncbi:MAG: hypothetical protein HYU67_03920 [Flavobacteriia bacterium]|nr:hypothetical protein [Flavobacteriia bacterium]